MKKNLLIVFLIICLLGTWGYLLYNNNQLEQVHQTQQTQIAKITDEKGQFFKNLDDALVRLDSLTGRNNSLARKLIDRDSLNMILAEEVKYRDIFNKAYMHDIPIEYRVLKKLNYVTECPKNPVISQTTGGDTYKLEAIVKPENVCEIREFFFQNKEYCHSKNCGFAFEDGGKSWVLNQRIKLDLTDSILAFKLYALSAIQEDNDVTLSIKITDNHGSIVGSYPDGKGDSLHNKIHYSFYGMKALSGVINIKKPKT